jgi:hypothetical protein
MGHPDGAHTHGHGGGSGLGELAVIVVLAVALPGPAVAAAGAELLHLLVIVAVALAAVAGAALVAAGAWRLRQARPDTARVIHRITPAPARPSPLSSQARQAIGAPRQVHLHPVRRERRGGGRRHPQPGQPAVNRARGPRVP